MIQIAAIFFVVVSKIATSCPHYKTIPNEPNHIVSKISSSKKVHKTNHQHIISSSQYSLSTILKLKLFEIKIVLFTFIQSGLLLFSAVLLILVAHWTVMRIFTQFEITSNTKL
jgi:uncharacterized membrane protein